MRTRILLACLWALSFSTWAQKNNLFNVKDFGATGQASALQTQALQKAIDACAAAGGGRVYFPPGGYLTATLQLKSGVELHLEAGATLLASRRKEDYSFTKGIYSTETDVPILIYGEKLKQVALTGRGTIDGQAEQTWEPLREVDNFISEETENARRSGVEMKRAYAVDPKVCLIYLTDCQDVLLSDLSIVRSPNWTVHVAASQRVEMRGLYVYSSLDKGVNADGLDIDGCQHVRISDCTVITGDDAICLKSTNKNGKYSPCEDVTVTNCTLSSTSTALKIGTESHGDFRRILFTNSTISNTNRGIGIFVRDGATVDGVIFSNLVIECQRKHFNWWGDGDPIRFVLLKRKPESRLGAIKNVLVENVIAQGQGTSLIAGFKAGSEEARRLENITLRNVQLTLQAEALPDKRATHGLRIEGIENLTVDGCKIYWSEALGREAKWQSGLSLFHIRKVWLVNSQINQAPGTKIQPISLEDVESGKVHHNRTDAPPGNNLKALKVKGLTELGNCWNEAKPLDGER